MVYHHHAMRGSRGEDARDPATTHNITGAGNTSPPGAGPPSGAERIRDAAIFLFGEHGFKGVSLKSIAEKAGVSAPLVVHHFGSKAGLRKACDAYAAETFRQRKLEAMQVQPLPKDYLFEAMRSSRYLTRYLLRAFLAGGPEMDELFDHLVDDAVEYTDAGEKMGLVYPCNSQRNRVALMLMQQFGSLMMAHQMKRHLGFDPLTDDPEQASTYLQTVMEIYTQPVINAEAYTEFLQFLELSDPDHEPAASGADPQPAVSPRDGIDP
ncbi:TetR family transcriptional regulator [Cellulosimicrobium funkei]|nr:TetR family transcriptional regulator [Cellulosimicrobium funkei]